MDSHDVDIRADIYSLGVTFYFLLTGRAPFEGLPMAQKLMSHQMKAPMTGSRNTEMMMPPDVLQILDQMTLRLANRYASRRAMSRMRWSRSRTRRSRRPPKRSCRTSVPRRRGQRAWMQSDSPAGGKEEESG